MPTVQILRNGQITLPVQIRQFFGLESGDYLETKIRKHSIVLKPKKLVDPEEVDQSWFWTKEWQEGEKRADEDIKASRVYGPFNNAKDAIKFLKTAKV